MNQSDFQKIADNHQPNEHKMMKLVYAFISGGIVGMAGEWIHSILLSFYSFQDASVIVLLIVIFIASLLTGLGIYDIIAQKCGAGLFIPISGFSNALTSSAMECRPEGLVQGIGSNMFKLAGSVITYGIVSALIFSAIRYGVYLL